MKIPVSQQVFAFVFNGAFEILKEMAILTILRTKEVRKAIFEPHQSEVSIPGIRSVPLRSRALETECGDSGLPLYSYLEYA